MDGTPWALGRRLLAKIIEVQAEYVHQVEAIHPRGEDEAEINEVLRAAAVMYIFHPSERVLQALGTEDIVLETHFR
jgi:hypothetical protein